MRWLGQTLKKGSVKISHLRVTYLIKNRQREIHRGRKGNRKSERKKERKRERDREHNNCTAGFEPMTSSPLKHETNLKIASFKSN